MVKLFRKSIVLNKKYILLGTLIAIGLSVGLKFDSNNNSFIFAYLFCPFILFYDYVGRLMYAEGIKTSEKFLLILPISKKQLILEKNFLSYIVIVLGIVIPLLIEYIFGLILYRPINFNIKMLVIFFSISLFYCTIYIYLNYVYNFHIAQKSSLVICAILLIFLKLSKNINFFSNVFIFLCIIFAIAFNLFVVFILTKSQKVIKL